MWDWRSGDLLKELEGHTDGISSMTLLGLGKLATNSYDDTLRIWNLNNGAEEERLDGISLAALASGESFQLMFSDASSILHWDLGVGGLTGACHWTLEIREFDDFGRGRSSCLGIGRPLGSSLESE